MKRPARLLTPARLRLQIRRVRSSCPNKVYRKPHSGYAAAMIQTEGARMPTDETRDYGDRHFRRCAYEGWTVSDLRKRAKQLGISGYSRLSKERLIALIRSY